MSLSVLYPRCAGLDVHKKTVVACVMLTLAADKAKREVRTFATTLAGLEQLMGWLKNQEVTHVAMESTGIYWRPVFTVLEGSFEVLVVNAQHMKAIPGHKTDVKDSEWIADLLRHGLLRASFIPPRPIRDLRDIPICAFRYYCDRLTGKGFTRRIRSTYEQSDTSRQSPDR